MYKYYHYLLLVTDVQHIMRSYQYSVGLVASVSVISVLCGVAPIQVIPSNH